MFENNGFCVIEHSFWVLNVVPLDIRADRYASVTDWIILWVPSSTLVQKARNLSWLKTNSLKYAADKSGCMKD